MAERNGCPDYQTSAGRQGPKIPYNEPRPADKAVSYNICRDVRNRGVSAESRPIAVAPAIPQCEHCTLRRLVK